MVGVIIKHNLVTVPEPVVAVIVIGGSNAEIESVKPKPITSSATQVPDVATANSPGEMPVPPGMIEVIAGVSRTGIVTHPFAIVVNVRRIRMPGGIGVMMFLRGGRMRRFVGCSDRGRSTLWSSMGDLISVFSPKGMAHAEMETSSIATSVPMSFFTGVLSMLSFTGCMTWMVLIAGN